MNKTILTISGLLTALSLYSQPDEKKVMEYSGKWSILSGLLQPVLLQGFNIAGTYLGERFTFEYSHGMYLKYPSLVRKDNGLTYLNSLYSTGPGVGYRFKKTLDLRFEVKVHQYEAGLNVTQSVKYTNLDCGFGIYSRRYIFRRKENGLKPFFLEHSFRYWQNIYSTLENGEIAYIDNMGKSRVHKPHNIGFFYNLSLGYTFGLNN
ncbi:MAG: hypothetical protein JNN04_02820 [Cyclobacteriaceae bacterium]|nr:hypothetical protein [Cyclobacteriaceae bacterium]